MQISGYAYMLGIICVVDTVVTAIGVSCGWFEEFNPLMRALMDWGGQIAFVSVKLVVNVMMIALLEWFYHKKGIAIYYKIAIFSYLVVYFVFSGATAIFS
jgi:hypothetical protein